eukprot:TRINITY_DN978_c0_g1_i1.p1 TRINITY_DN978_c0_g1~~TRINITY_DN978_c0_g1_i1.p1  ORF type:complete len:225 (-),score=56.18 TRINITY_DN978_c0_g1_i1:33-647(-)
MDRDRLLLLKVVVIGQFNVGKTSIIKRYVNNFWTENYKSTVGVDFALKVLQKDDTKINLQLWDIAGQERFNTMTRVYYKDAAGAILVFDASSTESWEAVEHWRDDLENKLYTDEPIPIILIGNKFDLIPEGSECSFADEVEAYAQDKGFPFFKCSAKTGENVEEAMEFLVNQMFDRNSMPEERNDKVDLTKTGNEKKDEEPCDC